MTGWSTSQPTPLEGWAHEKLTDPWAELLLERMMVDLKAEEPNMEKLTGVMIVNEFLTQCLAPLQAHLRPCGDSRARKTTSCYA